tara:strand:- start:4669 stop:11463 length:6795 start_codon:yes stop_codon:yes gene_type:complete
MPLSRLENFLKNIQGNVIYVDPNELDATDSIENQGNSQTRPFKTIQRALIEAARFSYVVGQRNDKFDLTTIILAAGTHTVDNRPGFIPYSSGGNARYFTRFGESNQILSPFGLGSNFDLTSPDNELYKLNSVRGGVIIPRGTSIVGKDLRKTKIRPKYVPDPDNNNIDPTAIFRLTGACYISQFTIFDGDPSGNVYKDYTANLFTPSFSHHKLTCFEYADGANAVTINDSFLNVNSTSTDLDMYYQKVGDVYDAGTGRPIEPDYPSGSLDFQTRVEEYRIVGSKGQQVGISSIKSGDGATASTVVTVDLDANLTDLSIDTPVRISGISTSGYNGIFVVSEVVSTTQFKYVVSAAPNNPLPTLTSANVNIEVDTINSASPYLFNLSKRSVFGMNGIHLDGAKVTGFKSGLLAQFTGNALQKDDKAFVRYNSTSGQYEDYTSVDNLHLDPAAIYRPEYESTHVRASNDSVIQAVSVFAIGHKSQYVADTGGELSLANCNANFGENALLSDGFKKAAFTPDNAAYITHLIPPKEIDDETANVDYLTLDVDKTIGVGTVTRLYFEGFTNQDAPPPHVVDGYRFGAALDDKIRLQLNINGNEGDFVSKIVMPTETGITTNTGEKRYVVNNAVGVSSISSNIISLKTDHNLITGESIRIIANDGFLPDGLEEDQVYFTIKGSNANDLKVARTLNDALEGTALTINNTGGELVVVSRVSDKKSGDIGHPIQFDIPNKNWFVNVSNESIDNEIYPTFVGVGTTALGANTPKSYFIRKENSRGLDDSIYKFRYVIPAGITTARPPIEGYVIQETSDTTGSTDGEITTTSLTNIDDQRNFHFLNEANWTSNVATVISEEPHNLTVGSVVNVNKITSANNATGIGSSGFNGRFSVIGITSARGFQYSLNADPGSSTLDAQTRTVGNLPNFSKNEYAQSFYIYESEEVKEHITGEQDGVYHLTCLHYDVKPTVSPFTNYKFSQPVKDLYPQVDRDNPKSDPDVAISHAVSKTIGKVASSDLKNSITKDTQNKFLLQNGISVGITSIVSDNGAGLAHTAYLAVEHNLNSILSVGIGSSGIGYGEGSATTLHGAKLVGVGLGSTASGGATANITIDARGGITGVTIVNGGGAYGIGNSVEVVGVTTAAGHVVGILTVTNVYSAVDQVVQIAGIRSDTNSKLNNTFRVTSTPGPKQVSFASTEIIDFGRSLGGSSNNITVGSATSDASMSFIGPAIGVTQISYDITSGIATVGTGITAHGLLAGSKVKLAGAGQTAYNGVFIVKENVGLNTFTVNLGVSTVSAPTLSGSVFGFPGGYSSADGAISADDEKIGSRMSNFFVGITTTLSSGITSTSSSIVISDASTSGLNIGDYIMVNDEMMRIKNTSINSVFRGVFGTKSTNHISGTQIKKVRVVPVESRRNSLIRAANQTFEYVGFGQGNYSVALPEKQTKVLSTEDRKLGQTQKRGGGQNFYTGLNDVGEYFIGNKVIKGTTGEEEIFDAPITSVTGEGHDVYKTDTDAIKVTGGANKDVLSEFNGPSIFTNKVTSTSVDGIEAVSLQLQGDGKVARKITVGIATPSVGGAAGDVVLTTKPSQGGYAGWVYTTQNTWRKFGLVSNDQDSVHVSVDKIGIGTTSVQGSQLVEINSGSINVPLVISSSDSISGIKLRNGSSETEIVGVGSDFQVRPEGQEAPVIQVKGNGNVAIGSHTPSERLDVDGTIKATEFTGDGSALTGVIGIGSGITVKDSGSAVGTAATVNFGDNLSVQFSVGIATIVGAAGTDNIITDKLNVTGISTLQNDVLIGSGVTLSPDGDIFATGITTVGILTVTGRVRIGGDLDVAGDITYDEITGRNLNITGVSTLSNTLQVGTGVTVSPDGDVFATGVTTSTTFVGNLTGNVTGDVTGDVTGTATNATNVTLADESTDTTCNVLFATGATGNLPPKTGTNLTFNSNTGDLTATSATLEHTTVGSAVTLSESGINVVGIITATTFKDMNGVGINTANVRTGILDVAGIATFRSNTLVGSGITLSPDGDVFATGITSIGSGITLSPDGDVLTTGITTIGKRVLGISTNNIIPFLYNNYSDLPSASTYHGAFVHVHVAGKAFYAHAGAWTQLVNVGSDLTVGLGTEKYNVGILTATTVKVGSGVTLSSDGDAFVTGISTATKFVGDLSDAVTSRWSVVNNGSSSYRFTGPGGLDGSADNSTIYVARGQTYEFNVNASGHPFQIRSSDGGSAYNTGVTNNGAAVGVVKFEVPFAAPAQLFYQCTNHSGMVGILSVFPAT